MELLVALAIVAIVASIAYPTLKDSIRKSRIQSETAHLMGDLMYTRSESIKYNYPVSICKSEDGVKCIDVNASDKFWDLGWIVFADNGDDGAGGFIPTKAGNGILDGGEKILRKSGAIANSIFIQGTEDFDDFLIYWPNGRSNAGNDVSQHFKVCSEDNEFAYIKPARKLTVEATGRPRVDELPEDENCAK